MVTLRRALVGSLQSGTSSIRHLDKGWNPLTASPDEALLAGTGRDERAIDIVIGGGRMTDPRSRIAG